MDQVGVMAINVAARSFILEDGSLCTIENPLDSEGEETDQVDQAVFVVGQIPDGRWVCIDRRLFTERVVH